MRGHLFLAWALALAALVFASSARAYCRKTTHSSSDESYDPSRSGSCGDATDALPLYWAEHCIEYRLIVDPEVVDAGKITTERAQEITHRAVDAWQAARCPATRGDGDRPPAMRILDAGDQRCSSAAPAALNEVHFTASPPQGQALAITDLVFDGETGRVLVSKMRIFDVYEQLGKTDADVDINLEYVVRHEMGHFVGLAHSDRTDAVMYATYRLQPVDGLSDDDVSAICAAYDPEAPVGAGCQMARGSAASGSWVLVALVASLIARRKRVAFVAALISSIGVGAPTARAQVPIPTVSVDSLPRITPPHKKRNHPKSARPQGAARKGPKRPPPPVDEGPRKEPDATPPPTPSLPFALPVTLTSEPPVPTSPDRSPAAPERDDLVSSHAIVARGADLYAGARYRAFLLPRAFLQLFGSGAKDLFFQSVAVEGDLRRGALSIVPALSFADLSSGYMLVGSRDSDLVSSFSYVRSDLKVLAASVAFAWSLPVSRTLDLELGLELGAGATFGTLVDNWVYETPNGPLSYGSRRFAACRTVNDGVGCRPQDHASPTPVRVGNAKETSMFSGGKSPTLIPWVSLPLVGLRAQVSDDVAMRIGVGASAMGFWAGASLDYTVAKM